MRRLSLALGATAILLAACGPQGTWSATGSMTAARSGHTATLLANGQVLVAGGYDVGPSLVASAELYDPGSGTWTATGSMTAARSGHTATLLPDGTVLVAGGVNAAADDLASAELYDPRNGTWTATGSLTKARSGHTATLLADGKVLVAGGYGIDPLKGLGQASAELYDPGSGTWTVTGSLTTARQQHTATLLADGQVLVVGGWSLPASAELYDPHTGTWTATGSMATGRFHHTATLLPDGQVLVAGGETSTEGGFVYLYSAELYNPSTGTWSATGGMRMARSEQTRSEERRVGKECRL